MCQNAVIARGGEIHGTEEEEEGGILLFAQGEKGKGEKVWNRYSELNLEINAQTGPGGALEVGGNIKTFLSFCSFIKLSSRGKAW